MNVIHDTHDMGGVDGRGPVEPEPNEPVFHAPWEGRVFGLRRLLVPWGLGGNWGSFRFAQERVPAEDYLRLSYYERWSASLELLLVEKGLLKSEEIDRRAASLQERWG